MNWLLLHTEKSIREKSHQLLPQPVTSDLGVFDLREKCHVSCCRDLGHVDDYSEIKIKTEQEQRTH